MTRNLKNYERLGLRKDNDSAEYFYVHKKTGISWIMHHSLYSNSPGEDWMPLEGDVDELLQKWKNKENMQVYATMEYLKKH